MFDLSGWFEVVIIVIVALIVLGPKEIPTVLRFLGKCLYRVRNISREFKLHIDDLVYAAEREDIKQKSKAKKTESAQNSEDPS